MLESDLEVWLVQPPAALGVRLLSPAERERAASFARPTDAVTYTASHIALRLLLGARLGVPPQDVAFTREACPTCGGPHGRPALAGAVPRLHFSLAHTRGLALIALAGEPVGADAERLPRAETVARCIPALHPRERAELEPLPPWSRRAGFAQLWTRKEAYLKAIGTGLSRVPARDYLGACHDGRPAGWSVLDVPCGSGHRAAVAIRGSHPASIAIRSLPSRALARQSLTEGNDP